MMGMLFALAIALSYLENMLPPIAGAVPGIKLGLSNIVTMYCLFIEG
ncbi:MAG: Gx transporter family protein, partial [Oscillospiraceae bacterium]